MSLLFSPQKTKNVLFQNRIMCSPCHLADSDENGFPNKTLLQRYETMGESKTGLVIPGYFYLSKGGKATQYQSGMTCDEHAAAWKPTVDKIHKNNSKIIFQICHGGIACNSDITGEDVVGPSALRPNQREMTVPEIETLIHDFKKAALRCKSIGVDGIMLHAAHGYLLSTFLSPITNHRKDKYGGSLENRGRLLYEISNELKSVASDDFLVSMKINGNDCNPHGNNEDDVATVIKSLPKMDFVEVSCGIGNTATTIRSKWNAKRLAKKVPKYMAERVLSVEAGQKAEWPLFEGYNAAFARKIKQVNPDITVAAVGGFRIAKAMNETLARGDCDMVSLGRPFIREPDLVKHLYEGQKSVECVSCGQCILFVPYKPPCRCYLKENSVQEWK